MFQKVLIGLACLFSLSAFAQKPIDTAIYDSIVKFRKRSQSETLTLDEKFAYAQKAVEYSKRLKVDSVTLKSNSNYALLCIYTGNFDAFRNVNFSSLRLAQKIRDSSSLAIANHNLGWYHHRNRNQNDSAYYYYLKAYKISEQLALPSRQIEILINLSEIQYFEKDYIGSEESAIKAIKLLEDLPTDEFNRENLWLLYNRIGGGATTMKLFEKSLEYHQKAYNVAKEMKDGLLLRLYSENNMAFVYKEQGNYSQALSIYQGILDQTDLFNLSPSFYALVLDNVAFAKFLNGSTDYDTMETMFEKAYHIADSLGDPVYVLNTTIDLSKFYKGQEKDDLALKYAEQSYHLAKEISSIDILLESMVILSDLKTGDEAKTYLKEHIRISDSLLAHERGIRNKFARIEFETDKIELENERIATEKMWWTISSIILLITSVLIYVIITQRNRNNALKFKQSQQEINEEIYNLMLSQQDKVDSARAEEKKRISQELHDGVLGRLFGTRLSLDSYNLKEGGDAINVRAKYISELKTIETDIRKISHDLNTDFIAGSGFMDIVTELIEKQADAYQLKYEFDHTDDINWDLVSNKTKIHIYRMLQETLQNIYKHAKAKTVKISFRLKKSIICLSISDDGIGFDPNKSKKGIGLKNIKSRAADVKGSVEFQSDVKNGTQVIVKIPYTT